MRSPGGQSLTRRQSGCRPVLQRPVSDCKDAMCGNGLPPGRAMIFGGREISRLPRLIRCESVVFVTRAVARH